MRSNEKIIVSFLIALIIVLLPVSPENLARLFSQADVNNQYNITGTEIWDQNKTIDHDYNVQPDATLIIKKGVVINFAGGNISVSGKMFIEGTLNSPVKMKREEGAYPYNISVYEGGEISARNADISGGGYKACMIGKRAVFNTAYACEWRGAIYSQYGKLDLQNVSFHDNDVALSIFGKYNDSGKNIRVNRSEFTNNSIADVYVGGFNSNLDFQYNWWGSGSGPIQICEDDYCWYEKIEGRMDYSNWRTEESFHDPVIIVPGILGSYLANGKWLLDPVGHTYDNLYAEFENNGYVPDEDLFTFGYDWENSNIDTAKLLKQKIHDVKEKANWPRVDLVTHSMGGLVARQYIESDDLEYGYEGDVDQLITLGTPNNGAPESYLKWEGDAWFWGVADLYGKHILDQEVKESDGKYADRFDYIHNKPVTSLQELLPVYNYLQDVENNYAYEKYPSGYPVNTFLEDLNSAVNVEKLNKIEFGKIIGNVNDSEGTIDGFKVIKSNMGNLWKDGYPLGFEVIVGDRGLIKNNGDRTVPIESAKSENVPADYTKEINSVHGYLPTAAQKDVLEMLTNKRPDTAVDNGLIHNILFVQPFSPIDIQVIDENGNWAGKNIKKLTTTQIKDSFYSGANLLDGSKNSNELVTIPNPSGEYQIVTEGTDNGNYTVEVSNISEDENNPGQAKESVVDLKGVAVAGKTEEKMATISADGVVTDSSAEVIPQETEMTPALFREKVEKYYQERLIKNKQARNVLLSGMKLIEDENRLLNMIKANPFLKQKTKKVLVMILERGIENQFDALIKIINKDKKNYDPTIKNILIEDLNLIKGNL